MPREQGGLFVINLYRAAVVGGISGLLWMQSHFMTREFFMVYRDNQQQHELDLMKRIDKIENKLDVLLHEGKLAEAQKKRLEDKHE